MITVAADKYLYNIRSYIPESINLKFYDPEEGLPGDLKQVDALLIRTVTNINKESMPNIPDRLKFIGTASAGSDHVDIAYLRKNNIAFSDAAGCNARSVAEYVATGLLLWSEQRSKSLNEFSVGIVGAGNTGSEVINLLNRLNISYIAYDPPREERDPDFKSATLEDLLSCNILTFHTPLNKSRPHPTFHWLDERRLKNNRFSLVINTSRGGVVDEKALLKALTENRVGDIIIDVWENEPEISQKVARKAFIKTPHIAGYSVQAKENASRIVSEALLKQFNLSGPENGLETESRIVEKPVSGYRTFSELLAAVHPVREYEEALSKILKNHSPERGKYFNRLRAEFPLRQQFDNIYLPQSCFERFPILYGLGFTSIRRKSE